jgi:hypothetical protein
MGIGRFWFQLQQRFGVFFVIGLALSVASFMAGLQLVHDVWTWVVRLTLALPDFRMFLLYCAEAISGVVEWWRNLIYPIIVWLKNIFQLEVPKWAADILSVLFFSLTRAGNRIVYFHGLAATTSEQDRRRVEAELSDLEMRRENARTADPNNPRAGSRLARRIDEKRKEVEALFDNYRTEIRSAWRRGAAAAIWIASSLLLLLGVDLIYRNGLAP